jgi:hypothetical protein
MLKRVLLAIAAVLIAAPAVAADVPGTGCKESVALVGQCFTVHGRLSWHANGRPYLQPAGTSRLFGFPREVAGLRRWLPEAVDPTAPGGIYARASSRTPNGVPADEVDIIGDFLVCPLAPEKPRAMRMMCMERADDLSLRAKTPTPPEK